ncbi:hypothetical protein PQR33_46150 [Paraburkholderia sediminicola]
MNSSEKSLRRLVEKWIGSSPPTQIRITRSGRTRPNQTRFVRVETSCTAGLRVFIFFRHGDGSWCVFPPAPERPSMLVSV